MFPDGDCGAGGPELVAIGVCDGVGNDEIDVKDVVIELLLCIKRLTSVSFDMIWPGLVGLFQLKLVFLLLKNKKNPLQCKSHF